MTPLNRRDRCIRRWNLPALILDTLLLGAIITQAVIYSKQLHQMRRSTDAAKQAANLARRSIEQVERNAHLDQRAWIAVADITGFPELGKPFRPKIIVTNTGRTFAKNMEAAGTGGTFDKDHIPDFVVQLKESANKRNPENISHALIAPNARTEVTMEPINTAPVDETMIKPIRDGDQKYFMFGQITYDDIFEHSHWMIFCVTLGFNPRQPENGGWNWNTYKEYNDTGDGQPPWKY